MGNHGLLLRLLETKSFFTVHAALQYLKSYPDNVGITYYLTRKLRGIDVQELREVWGFIWSDFRSKARFEEELILVTSEAISSSPGHPRVMH